MKKYFMRLYVQMRFGKITPLVAGVDGGVVAEVAFYDKRNKAVGYWAYGYYDNLLPYKGQDLE